MDQNLLAYPWSIIPKFPIADLISHVEPTLKLLTIIVQLPMRVLSLVIE